MKCTKRVFLFSLGLTALCAVAPVIQAQTLYNVNINTTGLNGTGGGLAFDLISGDSATPNNTALITGFATDGTLVAGGNTSTGAASGNLPGTVTLHDSAFSESFRGETFGKNLSYTLSLTNNFVGPGAPDEFSFFLTNPTNTGTVVTTSDPTGANALFILDLDGTAGNALTVFTPRTPGVSYTVNPARLTVPEGSSFALFLPGLLAGGMLVLSRRRRH